MSLDYYELLGLTCRPRSVFAYRSDSITYFIYQSIAITIMNVTSFSFIRKRYVSTQRSDSAVITLRSDGVAITYRSDSAAYVIYLNIASGFIYGSASVVCVVACVIYKSIASYDFIPRSLAITTASRTPIYINIIVSLKA